MAGWRDVAVRVWQEVGRDRLVLSAASPSAAPGYGYGSAARNPPPTVDDGGVTDDPATSREATMTGQSTMTSQSGSTFESARETASEKLARAVEPQLAEVASTVRAEGQEVAEELRDDARQTVDEVKATGQEAAREATSEVRQRAKR